MITLTQRAMCLATAVLQETGAVTVQRLSRRLRVSERSIRYDWDSVRIWLKGFGLLLKRKRGVGVWIEGNEDARYSALSALEEHSRECELVLTPQDREWLILAHLLSSDSPVSVGFLSRVLHVSRRTIYCDLLRTGDWLQHRGILLAREKGIVSLKCDEIQWRTLMVEYLNRNGEPGDSAGSDNRWASRLGTAMPILDNLGGKNALLKVRSIVAGAERALDLQLSVSVITALIAHILVLLARVQQGHEVMLAKDTVVRLRERTEWRAALWIVAALEQAFSLSLPLSEATYIVLYLLNSSTDVAESPKQPYREDIGLVARAICEKVGRRLGLDLMHDTELRSGLVGHLNTSMEKIHAGLQVYNPLLDEIRVRYPSVYMSVSKAVEEISEDTILHIPAEEIGWIALHIGAALERLSQKVYPWRILVVCASGLGIAKMLKTRLRSEFPQAQIKTMAAVDESRLRRQAEEFQADLIVSTIELHEDTVPVIVVSPFLAPRETARVAQALYSRTKPSEEADLFDMCGGLVRGKEDESSTAAANPSLLQVIRNDTMRMEVEAEDAEKAILAAGELLREKGIVSSSYVRAMLNLYNSFGPYMVIAPGVAMPHAAPEDGARQLGMGFIKLAKPVRFGVRANDPVDIVIPIAWTETNSHVRCLLELFRCLENGLAVQLRKAKTVDEMVAVVRGCLQ